MNMVKIYLAMMTDMLMMVQKLSQKNQKSLGLVVTVVMTEDIVQLLKKLLKIVLMMNDSTKIWTVIIPTVFSKWLITI